jgi:hypothetical protein
MMLPVTVMTERQAVVTRDLPAQPSVKECPARLVIEDRLAIGLPVVTDPAAALFALADDMDALYPADSCEN